MIQPEQQRRAYLEALGIDVWVPRDESEPALGEETVDDRADATAAPPASGGLDWPALREAVAGCRQCALHATRTQTVFGVGNENADWMIIGEAPGAEEDRRGEPFVGRAGKLLDEMLRAVGQGRDQVFIANILKCRPPDCGASRINSAIRRWWSRIIRPTCCAAPRRSASPGTISAWRGALLPE